MKKSIAILLSLVIVFAAFMAFAVPCFAADLSKDGVYSVPVTMLDPKKDKESMGNRFIEHTAKITVKDGKKTITVLMPKESDLVFCYYLDGSVSGSSKEAVKESNVELDGTTYPVGYTFPLVKEDGPVGLYFELTFLGIKPSARLAPDYSKLKAVKLDEETSEEATEDAAEVVEETAQAPEGEETTAAEITTVDAAEVVDEETSAIIGGADEATNIVVTSESAMPTWVYAAGAVVIIAVIAAVAVIVKKKKK